MPETTRYTGRSHPGQFARKLPQAGHKDFLFQKQRR
jgi:hypothetical protein